MSKNHSPVLGRKTPTLARPVRSQSPTTGRSFRGAELWEANVSTAAIEPAIAVPVQQPLTAARREDADFFRARTIPVANDWYILRAAKALGAFINGAVVKLAIAVEIELPQTLLRCECADDRPIQTADLPCHGQVSRFAERTHAHIDRAAIPRSVSIHV